MEEKTIISINFGELECPDHWPSRSAAPPRLHGKHPGSNLPAAELPQHLRPPIFPTKIPAA